MRPNDLNSDVLSKDALSLLQRILLATDGTVTDLLRLYTGEEIKARKIEQEIIHAGAPSMLLALPGTPILRRKVVLGRSGPTNLNTPLSGFPVHSGHDTPRQNGEPHE